MADYINPLSFCNKNMVEPLSGDIIDIIDEDDLIVFVAPNGESICLSRPHLITLWKNNPDTYPIGQNEYVTDMAAAMVKNNQYITVWKVFPNGQTKMMGNLFHILPYDDRYLDRARKIADNIIKSTMEYVNVSNDPYKDSMIAQISSPQFREDVIKTIMTSDPNKRLDKIIKLYDYIITDFKSLIDIKVIVNNALNLTIQEIEEEKRQEMDELADELDFLDVEEDNNYGDDLEHYLLASKLADDIGGMEL